MLKTLLVLLLFILGSSTVLCAADYVDTAEKTFTVHGKPQLLLRNSDGYVEVTPHQGDSVRVQVIKEIRGAKDESEAKREADRISVELEQVGGDQIRVITHWPHEVLSFGRRPSRQVKFVILTPPQTDVNADVSDGEIQIHGINGILELNVSDGDISGKELSGTLTLTGSDGNIRLQGSSGNMKIRLADGDLRAENCSGSIQVSSGDGEIVLPGFNGKAEISNSDGDVHVDGVLTGMNGKISDGTMTIQVAPGSVMEDDWSLRSSDGDIILDLPDDFSADLDLSTSDGEVQTDHPIAVTGALSSHRLKGKIRNGGHLLQIKSSDGDIAIH